MIKRTLTFLPLTLLLVSCAEKWGVYTVTHEERLPDGSTVRTIRHDDHVRCQILKGERVVGEISLDDGHIKTVLSAYQQESAGLDEVMTVFYDQEHFSSVYHLAEENASVMIIDKDGDGLPDVKAERSREGSLIQGIRHAFNPMPEEDES